MNNNQSSSTEASEDKQTKPDPKGKAIASFVLGMVSIIPIVLFLSIYIIPFGEGEGGHWQRGLFILFIGFVSIFTMIVGLIGLILGIKDLKSTKRNFAIVGIILCVIGLLTGLAFAPVFFNIVPILIKIFTG